MSQNVYRPPHKEEFENTKGYSKFVYQRRTENTMDKKKELKRTNNDLLNIHIKLKIEYYEPHSNLGVNSGSPEG
jgi:hypothetical protein